MTLVLGGPGRRERLPRRCTKCNTELADGCRGCNECGTMNPGQTCADWPGTHAMRCYATPFKKRCEAHQEHHDKWMASLATLAPVHDVGGSDKDKP